jgi:hypothetical protein
VHAGALLAEAATFTLLTRMATMMLLACAATFTLVSAMATCTTPVILARAVGSRAVVEACLPGRPPPSG